MNINEDMVIAVDERNGVYLEVYNGVYGVYRLELGNNEVWYKTWCFLSRWLNGKPVASDKKLPMAIRLGNDKARAVKVLEKLLNQAKRT